MNKKIRSLIMLPVMLLVGMVLITNVKANGFNVQRTITGVTNTAVNTFTYTAVSNTSGISAPSAGTVSFTSSDAVASNSIVKNVASVIPESAWTGLNYTQPGTYTFTVSEASLNNTVYPADSSTWVVTVYVTNEIVNGNVTGNLVKEYIGAMKTGTSSGKKGTGDNVPFTSAANMSKISVKNTLKGSLADTNEYFKYTVAITNGVSGTTYTVGGQTSGTITYDGSNVTTSNSCSGSSCTIYLKHNQTATIGVSGSYNQLPVGIKYTVTQNNTTSQGSKYTTTNKVGTAAAATGTTTGEKTVSATASNNDVVFENTSDDGTVPSGLFVKLFPFLVLLVLSGIGLYTVNKNKKLEVTE